MKYLKYLRYLFKHKWYVFIECCKLGIPFAGIIHDWSKFRPSEFFPYVNYFYGDCDLYGKYGFYFDAFDFAWLHHQNRNPHHWQYWVLLEDNGTKKVLPMPDRYCREMLADWKGAGKAITGKNETKEWYLKNKDKMDLHPETRRWIELHLGVNL